MKYTVFALSIFFTGCASVIESERNNYENHKLTINQYIQTHPELSKQKVDALQSNYVIPGMTLEEVTLALQLYHYSANQISYTCGNQKVEVCPIYCNCEALIEFEKSGKKMMAHLE